MKKEQLNALAILASAAMISLSGYFSVSLWAPKPERMIEISETHLTDIYNNVDSHVENVAKQLGECQAKLPPTPTPKETPSTNGTISTSNLLCPRGFYHMNGYLVCQ